MLSVIIPVYNDSHRLQLVLAGLAAQRLYGCQFEVHVVNDGGPRQLQQEVERVVCLPNATWHYLEPPSTVFRAGAARNFGAKAARGSRLLFLDGDCIPYDDVVAGHASYGPSQDIVCGVRLRLPVIQVEQMRLPIASQLAGYPTRDDERFRRGWHHGIHDFLFTDIGCCESCHVSYPTAEFRQLGGFWEEITGWGGEDIELAWRGTQLNLCLRARTDLRVVHLDHPRQPGARVSYQMKKQRLQELLEKTQQLPGLTRNTPS